MIKRTVMLVLLAATLCPLGHVHGMWNFERLQDPNKRALREHYELEKDTFLTAEPIFVVILLENTGNDPECCKIQEAWNLDIRDAAGMEFPARRTDPDFDFLQADTAKPCPPGYWTCYPGKPPVSSSRNLLDYYGKGVGNYGYYLPPGSYTISSKLFQSDTVFFNVVTPVDSMELAASDLLIYAADNRISVTGSRDKKYRFYRDFIRDHAKSLYTPIALRWLLAMPADQPPEYTKAEKQSYVQKMIRDFPTSHYFYLALPEFDPAFVKVEDRGKIIEGLLRGKANLKGEGLRKQIDELVGKLKK
jgi:hypothetical protein